MLKEAEGRDDRRNDMPETLRGKFVQGVKEIGKWLRR